jgi:hypothetical protein
MLKFIFKLFGYKIVKIKSRLDVMVENSGHYLCNDGDRASIIERLIALEDQGQELDSALDDIVVWEKVEYSFTVESFLDQIDTYVAY